MRRVIFCVVLAACGRDEPAAPSCRAVMDHILEISKEQIVGHGDMELGGQRDQMIAQCEARNLDADKRRCLYAAKNLNELAACKAGDANATPGPIPTKLQRKPRPPRQRE
jgi:hypothetical protein